MDSDVQDLALAQGIKDSLEEAGFDTVDSILKEAPLDISNKLGIEPYVAQIIKEVAKRATEEESYEKETKWLQNAVEHQRINDNFRPAFRYSQISDYFYNYFVALIHGSGWRNE